MDFDSRFECCKACSPSSLHCQNTPMRIQGQGDCKCNPESERSQNLWMNLDKGKKSKSKFSREMNKSGTNTAEDQKKFLDDHCYCFAKQNFSEKLRPETKQEKRDSENCNYFWESPPQNWSSKTEDLFHPEPTKRSEYSTPRAKLTESITSPEEKVDFLFRIFKDFGQEPFSENIVGQSKTKGAEKMLKDVTSLFDLNKRLCAAEEGIEKMALILEDLVNDATKKNTEDNLSLNDQLNFEEMSVSQRINYLKSRNDLMLGFIKTFLKAGTIEETYSRLGIKASDYDINQTAPSPKLDFEEKHHGKDMKREAIIETLKKLRMRMTELREKKNQYYNEPQKTRNDKRGETPSKYAKNKLEVISEQAELVLSDESENADEDFGRKNGVRSLKEKFSEGGKEPTETPLSVTSRILAEEAEFLKSSLDKVHFELFSHLEKTDKKFGNENSLQVPIKGESSRDDVDANYDCSSEVSCIFCDGDTVEKDTSFLVGKHVKPKPFKEPLKSFLEKSLKDSCKQSKHSEDFLECKLQSGRKIQQKNSYTIFPSKGSRNVPSVTDMCSSSGLERGRDPTPKEQRQRPMTEPSSRHKSPLPLARKPPVQYKLTGKNSGTNTVKNNNKILLSKKSCVQTS